MRRQAGHWLPLVHYRRIAVPRHRGNEVAMGVKQLLDLSGRTALVTGGSRGLGLQIAEALGEMGARVALTARKRDELDEACAHLESMGIQSRPLVCDMSNPAAIAPMVEQAASWGAIDILVNNAGTTWGADML